MNFAKTIRKYAPVLTVSLLAGAAGSAAIADDAGYHAKQLERIQSQTGKLLILSDAKIATQEPRSSAEKRRERAEADQSLTRSEELWKRFEQVTGRH